MYINKMKKIRKEKGMTLNELSQKTGVSTGYLCHLEKGTRKNPSIQIMENISNALGESVSKIFFE